MNTSIAGAQSIPKIKRNDNLSTDGKWRSFPKVPNLLQYVVAGTYYARRKVDGKPVRAFLETNVFTTAKLRLPDKLKELRKPKAHIGTFADGSNARPERIMATRRAKIDWQSLPPLSVAYRLRVEFDLESSAFHETGMQKTEPDRFSSQLHGDVVAGSQKLLSGYFTDISQAETVRKN